MIACICFDVQNGFLISPDIIPALMSLNSLSEKADTHHTKEEHIEQSSIESQYNISFYEILYPTG